MALPMMHKLKLYASAIGTGVLTICMLWLFFEGKFAVLSMVEFDHVRGMTRLVFDGINNMWIFDGEWSAIVNIETSPDCSLICVQVKTLRRFPISFNLQKGQELGSVRQEIRKILQEISPGFAIRADIALNEAVNNGLRAGNETIVKINLIGHCLILRIKDNGPGFDGNAYLRAVSCLSLDDIMANVCEDHGRGIFLMARYSDQILYNRAGNEVFMIKNL